MRVRLIFITIFIMSLKTVLQNIQNNILFYLNSQTERFSS